MSLLSRVFTSNSTQAAELERRVQQTQSTAFISVGGGGSGGSGAVLSSSAPQWVSQEATYGRYSYERMIYMRLQAGNEVNLVDNLFDYMSAYRYTPEKVAVFICNNGKYVVLEDDVGLFPSDSLVTQLRMLQK